MKTILILSVVFLCISCNSKPSIDIEKEKNAILQADQEYSDALTKKDIQKVTEYLDEEATFITDEMICKGRDETVKMWTNIFSNPTSSITRHPSNAFISASGDFGYSMGPYESIVDSSMTKGTYLYIWKKQSDGSWKALVLKP